MNNQKKTKKITIGLRLISLFGIITLVILSTPVFAEGQTKVELCHKPGSRETTLKVAESAVNAHLTHGDNLGQCAGNFKVCPFEPITITLTSSDPVNIPVQIVELGQDLNFSTDDPPGVHWAITELDGTILLDNGADDHFHFTWAPYNFSNPGFYYVVFDHPLAGTTYPTVQVNLACVYDAPEP